jgi:hypothetical protein
MYVYMYIILSYLGEGETSHCYSHLKYCELGFHL